VALIKMNFPVSLTWDLWDLHKNLLSLDTYANKKSNTCGMKARMISNTVLTHPQKRSDLPQECPFYEPCRKEYICGEESGSAASVPGDRLPHTSAREIKKKVKDQFCKIFQGNQ